MTFKQIIFSITLFSIIHNNILAMNNDNNTLARPDGYWNTKMLTSPDHQREDWYQYTNYIAEPWCTISNAGFFATAYSIKNSHPLSAAALTFAGTASAISHIIPYHSLNIIDRIGAWSAMAAVAYDTKFYTAAAVSAALKNPKTLASLLAMGTTVLTDHYIAHSEKFVENSKGLIPSTMIIKRKNEHKWIHVLWHVLAAWAVYTLLTTNLSYSMNH